MAFAQYLFTFKRREVVTNLKKNPSKLLWILQYVSQQKKNLLALEGARLSWPFSGYIDLLKLKSSMYR